MLPVMPNLKLLMWPLLSCAAANEHMKNIPSPILDLKAVMADLACSLLLLLSQ